MTLSDLERLDAMGQIFQADLLNNAIVLFDLERPYRQDHSWGGAYFYRGHPRPHREGQCPIAHPSIYACTLCRRNTKCDV